MTDKETITDRIERFIEGEKEKEGLKSYLFIGLVGENEMVAAMKANGADVGLMLAQLALDDEKFLETLSITVEGIDYRPRQIEVLKDMIHATGVNPEIIEHTLEEIKEKHFE